MIWSKIKQQLEGFLSPALIGRVEYSATGYRYLPDKSGRCYIRVDKREIFNMRDATTKIRWYLSEQEIKGDHNLCIPISRKDFEVVVQGMGDKIPEDRIAVIAKNRKISDYAKEMMVAQEVLCKSDFYSVANRFLTDSIENNLESKEILLNIFALIDRRVGKKRLLDMEEKIRLKHPIVQYFYHLRCSIS